MSWLTGYRRLNHRYERTSQSRSTPSRFKPFRELSMSSYRHSE